MCALQPSCCDVHEAGRRLENLNAVMSGGHDLGSYLNELRAQGQSQCTNIWFKGVIAYRCRTCQLNDSSAICVECFQNGRHRDHDYVNLVDAVTAEIRLHGKNQGFVRTINVCVCSRQK